MEFVSALPPSRAASEMEKRSRGGGQCQKNGGEAAGKLTDVDSHGVGLLCYFLLRRVEYAVERGRCFLNGRTVEIWTW